MFLFFLNKFEKYSFFFNILFLNSILLLLSLPHLPLLRQGFEGHGRRGAGCFMQYPLQPLCTMAVPWNPRAHIIRNPPTPLLCKESFGGHGRTTRRKLALCIILNHFQGLFYNKTCARQQPTLTRPKNCREIKKFTKNYLLLRFPF